LVAEYDSSRGRGNRWSPGDRRRSRERDWLRKFDWSISLPGEAPTNTLASVGGSLPWLAVPAVLCVAAVLLIPVANRLRPRLASYLWTSRSLASFSSLHLASREELVRAVDRFLACQFGRASSWWHCRAVERALVGLRPEMGDEISHLVATYQVSRYGPQANPITVRQLEESAGTLRRLTQSLLSANEPTAPANAAA
jgi:hypothetical protein